MIRTMQQLDILEGLKRGHHVFVDLPLEGGGAALRYQSTNGQGYGLLAHLQEDHPTLQVGELPTHKSYDGIWRNAADLIGDIHDWYDEAHDVTWHFVYTHTVEGGHLPTSFWNYELITTKLDEWWNEHEADIPFGGVHAVWFGHGVHHSRVGEYRSVPIAMLSLLANSECEFDLRYQ